MEQVLNLDDLISENDPLRDAWLANTKTLSAMNDRSDVDDAMGYPQVAVRLWMGSSSTVGVVLTPFVPAP